MAIERCWRRRFRALSFVLRPKCPRWGPGCPNCWLWRPCRPRPASCPTFWGKAIAWRTGIGACVCLCSLSCDPDHLADSGTTNRCAEDTSVLCRNPCCFLFRKLAPFFVLPTPLLHSLSGPSALLLATPLSLAAPPLSCTER